MKKTILSTGILLVSSILLAACGSSTKTNDSPKNSTTVASSSVKENTVESSQNANQENLDQVAKKLEEKFNTDGKKLVKAEVQNGVSDDTADVPHSVVEVRVIDDESRKSLEEAQNAINANSASDVQRTQIYGIQVNVEEIAKTLESENDTIKFIVPSANGNNIAIAFANKNENIIPLVM